MTVKTYVTDTLCPCCEKDILQSLLNRVYSEGGRDFEWECDCGNLLSVEVNPVPAFSIMKSEAPQHGCS